MMKGERKMKYVKNFIIMFLVVLLGVAQISINAMDDSLGEEVYYASKSENLAYLKTAYASSNQRGDSSIGSRVVRNLTDGDTNSYIVLHQDDTDPWYYIDLEQQYSINKVVLYQGATTDTQYVNSYASVFTIEYKDNLANEWIEAKIVNGIAGKNTIYMEPITARYVRMHVVDQAGTNSMLYEMQVHETDYSSIINPEQESESGIRILFIGNSLTHYNDVAGKVKSLFEAVGQEAEVTTIIQLGRSLVYHATFDSTRTAILEGDYDYVVLQDKASNFNSSELLRGVTTINEWIKQTNAKPILYMPWANENIFATTQKVFTDAYVSAAKSIDAKLAPAGESYYELYFDYGCRWYSDNIHGNDLASFVSASTIFYTISGIDTPLEFVSSDSIITKNSYDLETCNLIQQIASYHANKFRDLSLYNDDSENSEVIISDNLALNKTCVSSSEENIGTVNTNVNDGNANTRWSSAHNDSEWIYVDLGKTNTITKVKLNWEAAYAKKYAIQVSANGVDWYTVADEINGSGGVEELTFASVETRYVKMLGIERALPYGYSLWEMEVYE